MKGIRPNRWSDGRSLEHELELIANLYSERGILRLGRTTPPTRTWKEGESQRVCFLKNCWCDFAGVWSERSGRMLVIEAKVTQEPVLDLAAGKDGKGGLSKNQIENLLMWERAGAAVGVIWQWQGKSAWISTANIQAAYPKEKHIHFRDLAPISQGEGFLLIDFVQNLRACYPND